MSDSERYRGKLLALRAALEADVAAGADAAKPVELDQTRIGRVSRMDAMQTQAMSVETQRRRELQLTRIATALERIEAGSFGECVRCGDTIDEQRLDADPSTPSCIDCARAAEQ